MFAPTLALRTHKQLILLILWIAFVGWSLWQHAQHSQQPPIYDAFSYYQKAHGFWSVLHQGKWVNPFNVEPSFRPPGTILMSYPFGFHTDYRGFYFRSTFLPIVLLSFAVVIAGYRRELDSKSKWHLVLIAAFLASLPCFYHFEVSSIVPAPDTWGIVDNFLAGVAALAAAAVVRSIWTRSYTWLALGAILASFCLLIKPTGMLIMMLIGLAWFGLTVLKLRLAWQSADERKSATRWLLLGMLIFAVPYLLVLAGSFTSHYLSVQNLAFGKAAIVVMQKELLLSWPVLRSIVHMGLGYPFVAWFFLMLLCVGNYFCRASNDSQLWTKPLLASLSLASCSTFIFGVWFWLFGSGGTNQIRYFYPFVFMTAVLALPPTLMAVRAIPGRKMAMLSVFMIAPVINMGMLLPQRNAPIKWQIWTGVNLTSSVTDAVMVQAQNFVAKVKNEGDNNIIVYAMSMDLADSFFTTAILYAGLTESQPIRALIRPVDWQRPTTYRKREMFNSDYWLFKPVRDPDLARATVQSTSPIDTFQQEKALFEAWATQLTTNDGVSVVSETPTARVLRITDLNLLERSFDSLVANHHWREIFVTGNLEGNFSEKDIETALAFHSPSIENVNFSDSLQLRALSVSRLGDFVRVRFWWKPQIPLNNEWELFIHSIDAEGKVVLANNTPIRFNRSLSSPEGVYSFDQMIFFSPIGNGTGKQAIGFTRPNNNDALIADRGTRDWDNRRVIIPMP